MNFHSGLPVQRRLANLVILPLTEQGEEQEPSSQQREEEVSTSQQREDERQASAGDNTQKKSD